MRPVSNRAARPIGRSIDLKVAHNPFGKSIPIFGVMRNLLRLRNSGRKTAAHFCWNCSRLLHQGVIKCFL
jgi:hypothetical protein